MTAVPALICAKMALSENIKPNPEKPAHENKQEKREKPPTKVVIRRLPPRISEQDFLSQVSPLPDYDYIYIINGDTSLGENSFSRVYINFVNQEDIFNFKEKFDNYVFVDDKGHEYAAVVEFAAFQKIPKKRGKFRTDPKVDSIETDPMYLQFLESLKEQPNQDEKPEYSYQPSNENKLDLSTPLLNYVKQKKLERLKSRDEKREERRKRELERKRFKDEERKKRFDEKYPPRNVVVKPSSSVERSAEAEAKDEDSCKKLEEKVDSSVDKVPASPYKNKEKKFDDYKQKPKPRFPTRVDKYDGYEKKDFKSRREDYREPRGRFDAYRKEESETKQVTKKVKKYSERREEWKNEAKRTEENKETACDAKKSEKTEPEIEQAIGNIKLSPEKKSNVQVKSTNSEDDKETCDGKENKCDNAEKLKSKHGDGDPRLQRRIRNKDRPTMALYQPGMLSKRKQVDDDKDSKELSLKE